MNGNRSSGWVGRPGAAIRNVPGNSWMAPAGEHHLVIFRFPVGISNACAMLQLASRIDSSAPAAATASAPRMGNDENRTGGTGGPATSVIAKVKPKTKRPNLYRVLILNDDYTPMEFVVHVLEKFSRRMSRPRPRSCCTSIITESGSAGSSPTRSPRPR